MSVWRKRRLKRGLSVSEVANYLDINYDKYLLIDKGEIKMPNKYIEKFNDLINRNKGELNINKLTREQIVNEWWNTMSTRNETGKFKLYDKMREFNISTLGELGALLGYSRAGAISNYLTGARPIKFDTKNRIYSFFENELNIQAPKTRTVKKRTNNKENMIDTKEYTKLLAWYEKTDFAKWATDHGLDRKLFREKSGLSYGTVHSIFTGLYRNPQFKTLTRLKDFIDNYTEKPVNGPMGQVMTFTCVPTEEVPEDIRRMGEELVREVNENMSLKEKLLTKYEQELENLDAMIAHHEAALFDLRKEKEFYEKIINDINED